MKAELKAESIRGLSADELEKKVGETRQELFNLRFQHATGALEDTASISVVRRNLARLMTVQRELAKES